MPDTFNFRNPQPGEVTDIQAKAQKRRLAYEKYKLLHKLLNGETINLTHSPQLFEALNREKMEFEEIMKLHPDQVQAAIEEVKRDREAIANETTDPIYWNRKSQAGWRVLGHFPPCVYYARPAAYWKDKKILKEFFNQFSKFRVSKKPL